MLTNLSWSLSPFHLSSKQKKFKKFKKSLNKMEEEELILDLSKKGLSEKDIRAKMFRGYEHVNLSRNEIMSLKGFPRLTRVKALNLSGNSLSEFHHVGDFLNKLDLSYNYFDSISGLPNRLVSLSLAGNWITECTGFEHLTKLNYLDLRENLIDSFGSVRSLSFNKNLRTLLLKGNPIERSGGAYVVFDHSRFSLLSHTNTHLISHCSNTGMD